jgi:hypothetical protein|tara:strand:+ start:44 stop:415 length:372 start_codon:yes stop_codon:yes gene_type:complete
MSSENENTELFDRVSGTNLVVMENSRGVSWTIDVTLDGETIGTVEYLNPGGTADMVPKGDKRNEVSEVSNALIECGHGGRWGVDWDIFAYLEPPMTLAQAIELEENFDLDDLAALYNQTNASE